MNKYVKIGLIGATIGAIAAGGYHVYKYHPIETGTMFPVLRGQEEIIIEPIPQAQPLKLIKTDVTHKNMA